MSGDWFAGVPVEEPERKPKSRKGCGVILILVAAAAVGCALLIVGVALLVPMVANQIQGLGDQANAFMTAIQDGDVDAAYGMLNSEARERIRSGSFREQMSGVGLVDWTFNQFSIQNERGHVGGEADFPNGRVSIALQLRLQDGVWQVSGYDLGGNRQGGERPVSFMD
jgi:hypothetical protein